MAPDTFATRTLVPSSNACFYTQIHINSFGTVFFWCSGSDCGCFGKTAHLGRAFSVALEDPVVAALRRRVLDFVAFSF